MPQKVALIGAGFCHKCRHSGGQRGRTGRCFIHCRQQVVCNLRVGGAKAATVGQRVPDVEPHNGTRKLLHSETLVEQVDCGSGQQFFCGQQILAKHGTQQQLGLAARLLCPNIQSDGTAAEFKPLHVDESVNARRARAVGQPVSIAGFGKQITCARSAVQGRVGAGSAINHVVAATAINGVVQGIAHNRIGCCATGGVFILTIKPPQTNRA